MSSTVSTTTAVTVEPEPGHPVRRILIILALVICGAAFAELVGWDLRDWFSDLWGTLTSISVEYIVAAVFAVTVQTTATAFAWFSILRYAYPDGTVRWSQVYAAYATCVAMNNILPANLGTIMMFVMLTTVIAAATFAGLLGGFAVQKIFFVLAGTFVYLYLFLSVPGSFDRDFAWIKEHPAAVVILVVAGLFVLILVVRSFWAKVVRWWEQAKEGGQILTRPAAYLGRVFLPEFVAWVASLSVVAIFLAAYAIPVTFHSVMSVVGSNSISNTVSVTPGGAGVNQAFNVAALNDVTDTQTATAYSVAQQLITTAWTLLMALLLMIWVFGWGGGKGLVQQSYEQAKQKAQEQKAKHGSGGPVGPELGQPAATS
ncbi:MAG TPA: YbhN family protein [Gaiellaceae bacterium]|nr:YbhN family protein [Gaiellaceae bacterium]